jgi:hypothetical protein
MILGRPHVAPGVFAIDGEVFCSPTDAGQGRRWPGGCAIWTGTSGSRSGRLLRRGLVRLGV